MFRFRIFLLAHSQGDRKRRREQPTHPSIVSHGAVFRSRSGLLVCICVCVCLCGKNDCVMCFLFFFFYYFLLFPKQVMRFWKVDESFARSLPVLVCFFFCFLCRSSMRRTNTHTQSVAETHTQILCIIPLHTA